MPVTQLGEQVLAVLNAAAGRPLKAKDISRVLDLPADDRGDIRQVLFDLVDDGRALQLPNRRFVSAAAESPALGIKGTIQRKPSGIAWFVPHDKSRKDAFLPPSEMRGVVDGDVVMAKIERAPKGPVANIVKVLERSRRTITGTLHTSHDRRFGRVRYVEVDDNVLSGPVRLTEEDAISGGGANDVAKEGDVVEVELLVPPTATTNAEGRIIRRLGEKGALDVEIERLVTQAGVSRVFPPAVLSDAGRLGEVPGEVDFEGREDLRALPIVTIDGETAKDFDDAVFARQRPRSTKIDVTVCVADVSYYVTEDAPLDREARLRGTSIYYPGRVIPMLPEALSNGLCSLRPRVPRLCTFVTFTVDEAGGVHDERLAFGVMQSRARLTYSLVQRFLDEEEGKAEPHVLPPQPAEATLSTKDLDDETRQSLRDLAVVARRLREARRQRGALDFELPELVIELDEQKEPTGLRHNERVESQKLIEDLMIGANEAAARFFDEQNFPSIYRIHEQPDEEKLSRFLDLARPAFLEQTGKGLPKEVLDDPTSPSALMTLMHGIGEHPSRQALDMLLLRSMKQARYSVDNVGHYGLGSTAYLHFTSPIRRYPDLVVHRQLRARLLQLGKKGKKAKQAAGPDDALSADDALLRELEDMAESSSERERKATDLERQIQALHACWLMKDRVGEIHDATVTGASEAGAFVRLNELHVDGLVRTDALGREYFAFDQQRLQLVGDRSREVIGVGTILSVEVFDVDLSRRQISFVRVLDEAGRPAQPGKAGNAGKAGKTGKTGKPGRGDDEQRVHAARGHAGQAGRSGAPSRDQFRPEPYRPAAFGAPSRSQPSREPSRGQRPAPEAWPARSQPRAGIHATPAPAGRPSASDDRRAKAVVAEERRDRRDERQDRYERQQQRRTPGPVVDEAELEARRQAIRGPDSLRAVFSERGPLSKPSSRYEDKPSPRHADQPSSRHADKPSSKSSHPSSKPTRAHDAKSTPKPRALDDQPSLSQRMAKAAEGPSLSKASKEPASTKPSTKPASKKPASTKPASTKATDKAAAKKPAPSKSPDKVASKATTKKATTKVSKEPATKAASSKAASTKAASTKAAKKPAKKPASTKKAAVTDKAGKKALKKADKKADVKAAKKAAAKTPAAKKSAAKKSRPKSDT